MPRVTRQGNTKRPRAVEVGTTRPEPNGHANHGSQDIGSPESLDKVRDILFGTQMRGVEGRLVRLEERLTQEAEALKENTEARLGSMESYVRKELDALGNRLKAERAERGERMKELSRDLQSTAKALEKRLDQLAGLQEKEGSDLRKQILDQSRTFADQLQQRSEELRQQRTLEHRDSSQTFRPLYVLIATHPTHHQQSLQLSSRGWLG